MTATTPTDEEVRQHRRTRRFRTGITLLMLVALLVLAVDYALEALAGDDEDETAAVACATSLPPEELPPAFPLPARQVPVAVLNAAGERGLAGTVGDQLGRRGFDVRDIGNEPAGRVIDGIAEVRYGPRGYGRALTVLAHLPGARLVEDARRTRLVDVALGQRFESIGTNAQVRSAYRREVPLGCGEVAPPPAEQGAEGAEGEQAGG